MGEYAQEDDLDASGMRFAIAVARFNRDVTEPLLDGARRTLEKYGADDVDVVWVPGAFELPLIAQRLATSGRSDAVICIGAVVRGDTPHFDYVAGECAAGIQRAALDTGTPIVFGVLTTDDLEQAMVRTGGSGGHTEGSPSENKGAEAARTAVEMVALTRRVRPTEGS
jgi:6,7-dimethyl-8-ribityllumazine synthase